MNDKNIQEIIQGGGSFGNVPPNARPYLSPLWETIIQMIELIAIKDGECEAHDIAITLNLNINTTRHYLTALVKSGFPINREELTTSGRPKVYRVNVKKIKFLASSPT